jgi:glycerol kinase
MLLDIDARDWDGELCSLFGVDPAWLPDVRTSAASFGTARLPGGAEVPIHGIAGDQQAALFGQGCFDEGTFKNTYGTGCFLLLNTGRHRVDSQRGLVPALRACRNALPKHFRQSRRAQVFGTLLRRTEGKGECLQYGGALRLVGPEQEDVLG